ncbi:MAG: hypothetical protein Q9165_006285 [Trypethelium subeluteriae]
MSQAQPQSLSGGLQRSEPLVLTRWCHPCILRLALSSDEPHREYNNMDAPLEEQQEALDKLLCKPQAGNDTTACHGCRDGRARCEKAPIEFTNRMHRLLSLIEQHQGLTIVDSEDRGHYENKAELLRWKMRALAMHMDHEPTAPRVADVAVYRAQKLNALHAIKDEIPRFTAAWAAIVRIVYAFVAATRLTFS